MSTSPTNPVDIDLTCPECDYNLTGATADRCPWCGWKIETDALTASVAERGNRLRWGVAATALAIGCGSLAALGSTLKNSRQLTVWDGSAVLAVFLPAVGHLVLAGLAAMSRRHWPMRRREARIVFGFIAILAVALAILGAVPTLQTASTPLIARGFPESGFLAFTVATLFYSLPGCLLLILRVVSFRNEGCRLGAGFAGRSAAGGEKSVGTRFFLEFARRYGEDQVTQSWCDVNRHTSRAVERIIARTWKVKLALASQTGGSLYDGDLARLLRAESSENQLHLVLGATCYRDFLGTNLHNAAEVSRFGPEYLADPLGISATAITRDGRLTLGRRGHTVAYHAGYLHTFGGLLEPPDRRVDGSYDIFGATRRELIEELGLEPTEIASLHLIGLVRDRAILQPELLFDAVLTITHEELSARFNPALSGGEHTGIEFVQDGPDSIVPFLRRMPPVAPVAEAALLLHGLGAWGIGWFEHSCRLLHGEPPRAWRNLKAKASIPW